MTISTSRLNAIRAVAEGGSYAGAARLLGVTQPNVSGQVRALEAEFGVRLFMRESGQLVPTTLCLKLCDLAERAAEARDVAERLMRAGFDIQCHARIGAVKGGDHCHSRHCIAQTDGNPSFAQG